MRHAILTVAAAVLLACATEPQGPHYSLAGNWSVSGGPAAFSFTATDSAFSADALADSASHGIFIEAYASGGSCSFMRYRTGIVSNSPDDGVVLWLRCPNRSIEVADRFATLPDRVQAATIAGLTLQSK